MNLRSRPSRGSVLVPVLILVVLCAAAAAAMTSEQVRTYQESEADAAGTRVFAVAEGALDEAVAVYASRGADAFAAVVYPQVAHGITYTVTATRGDADPTLDDDLVKFVAVAEAHGVRSEVTAVHREIPPAGLGSWGVFGRDEVTLDSNASSDSYDSRLGRWATQGTNKDKSMRYAETNGAVASNGPILMDSNTAVYGDVTPGRGETVTLGSGARVTGSTTSSTYDHELDAVDVPSITASGAYSVKGERSATLGPGDLAYTSFRVGSNSNVTVYGPATLVVEDFAIDSNVTFTADVSAGPVSIYVTRSFSVASNTTFTPTSGRPKDLSFQFAASGATLEVSAYVELVGTLYSPESEVVLDSNGSIEGYVVGRSVLVGSNTHVHLDESLFDDGDGDRNPTYPRISWSAAGAR